LALRAGAESVRQNSAPAAELYARAAAAFQSAEMAMHAAAAHRRQGEITGGTEGSALVASADNFMARHGIRQPPRVAAALVPG
jgi:hypothetical protein